MTLGILGVSSGCIANSSEAERSQNAVDATEVAVVVDVAEAQLGSVSNTITYTGTTEPVQQVSLRSQTEGQLLSLFVDVGDQVDAGDVLGQVDEDLLQTEVADAEAELAAREFLVIQAEAQLADAHTQVERAIAELQQAESDADRLRALSTDGAIAEQTAEQAQTAARTAQQAVRSAEQIVRTREQAIAAAQRRVDSQQAILDQARERLSRATLISPLSGTVMARFADPGDFMQTGQEVLQLGDLSGIHVLVQIADRELSQIQVGQLANVELDAFPTQTFVGRITRISPAADATARLIPIEITLANPGQNIGSGLIARVNFGDETQRSVFIPPSAFNVSNEESSEDSDTIFVLIENGDQLFAESRQVVVGDRSDEQVEILSGLEPGESYIIRSDETIEANQLVQRSILSES